MSRSSTPRLPADRGDQPDPEVLFRMRDDDMAGTIAVFEQVLRASDPIQRPPCRRGLPDRVRALRRAHDTTEVVLCNGPDGAGWRSVAHLGRLESPHSAHWTS